MIGVPDFSCRDFHDLNKRLKCFGIEDLYGCFSGMIVLIWILLIYRAQLESSSIKARQILRHNRLQEARSVHESDGCCLQSAGDGLKAIVPCLLFVVRNILQAQVLAGLPSSLAICQSRPLVCIVAYGFENRTRPQQYHHQARLMA